MVKKDKQPKMNVEKEDVQSKYEKLLSEYNKIQVENGELKKKNEELETRLKKYTAPDRNKKYYQNHKEEIKEKVKEYVKKTNYKPVVSKEKRKEYSRRAYLKKKEKLENECV